MVTNSALQRSVAPLLSAIYEKDVLSCSRLLNLAPHVSPSAALRGRSFARLLASCLFEPAWQFLTDHSPERLLQAALPGLNVVAESSIDQRLIQVRTRKRRFVARLPGIGKPLDAIHHGAKGSMPGEATAQFFHPRPGALPALGSGSVRGVELGQINSERCKHLEDTGACADGITVFRKSLGVPPCTNFAVSQFEAHLRRNGSSKEVPKDVMLDRVVREVCPFDRRGHKSASPADPKPCVDHRKRLCKSVEL